jgi:hypothetical protein
VNETGTSRPNDVRPGRQQERSPTVHQLNASPYLNRIVIEHRYSADITRAERIRQFRESQTESSERANALTTTRQALGTALIRAGKLLGGAPAPAGHVVRNAG